MTTDKTGAPTTVTEGRQTYTIAVEGQTVGHADYADRGDQRVFYHTVVDPEYGGRGLATILVEEALNGARDAGKRIVPVCSMSGAGCRPSPAAKQTSCRRRLPIGFTATSAERPPASSGS
jgi:predicted GNAT family acetyltransferase